MLAIFKREFKSYFQNVIGWLFVAALLAVYGLYFYVYNLKNGYPYISYDLNGIGFIMMIAVPILTMRSLSDEKKTKTDQLMLTSPVSVGRIVAGKYFAMATVYTIVIALFALSPLVLSIYGKVALSEAYVALFGYWLYGLSCIAVGLFISSISESVIISAILTFAALFLSYMMQSITGLISSSGNLLTKVLNCFDLYTPFENFRDRLLSGKMFRNHFVGFDYYRPEVWSPMEVFHPDVKYPQYGSYVGRIHYYEGVELISKYGHNPLYFLYAILLQEFREQLIGYKFLINHPGLCHISY